MTAQISLSKSATAVYDQLRQQILDGRIVSGAVLQQVELAQRLGVSRTPVRHALQQLAYDGLVEFLPGQSARVVAPSFHDTLEMRQIRLWLEVPALLLALRRDQQPTELLNILDQIAQLGEEPTREACTEIVKLDEQFHRWLLRESGNRNLERIGGRLLDILFRSKSFNIAQDYSMVKANLLAMREAVQAHDLRLIRQLMIEHMTDTGMLAIEPVGFDDNLPGS